MQKLESLIAEAVAEWQMKHTTLCEHTQLIEYGRLGEILAPKVCEQVLNAAADQLDALPKDGTALKGPYWYREGFKQAGDMLRDWADYPAALHALKETR
ncbi:hypothetical protein [Actinomadura montaniterrae]|uniref:Uncharacterized protein n=1 Tax=Actinomadura montaniterrae TaxID=1803903 RepID=A0A6L3W2K8_9ACTN|nr:hypothetical protein [Actinomadura montaniterrae]KAB2384737.1 hypothetical protein F9B16_09830 [Actinomadura montaniterrae]